MVPTFYDPIEMDDIDIDDSAANFYIIKVEENNYKFCATTQNLNAPEMRRGDPETRVRFYWPITREQLNQANIAVLFPNDKIRTSTITAEALQEIFHFNPVEQDNRVFGHHLEYTPGQPTSSITWQTRPPQTINGVRIHMQRGHLIFREYMPPSSINIDSHQLLMRFHDIYVARLTEMMHEVRMNHEQINSFLKGLNPFSCPFDGENLEDNLIYDHILFNILNIYPEKFPFDLLVHFSASSLKSVLSFPIRESIENDQFTLRQLYNLYQHLRQAGVVQLGIKGRPYTEFILQNVKSIRYLLNGTLTIQDFVTTSQVISQKMESFNESEKIQKYEGLHNGLRPGYLFNPLCMLVIKKGLCTAEDLMNLDIEYFFEIIDPTSLKAILEGKTTLEALKNMAIDDLQEARISNQFPDAQTAPKMK
jgi:hypothetical protein